MKCRNYSNRTNSEDRKDKQEELTNTNPIKECSSRFLRRCVSHLEK